MTPHDARPPGVRTVRELALDGFPALSHPEWHERFPWLLQGTTTRGDAEAPYDLGTFSHSSPAGHVMACWERLRGWAQTSLVVHARQVHGARVRIHEPVPGQTGIHFADPCDAHATRSPGTLVAVTTADCVPVSLVDPGRRAVALAHAGWRGAAAGVLERALDVLLDPLGARAAELHVHLGPAICGACYEVGPEVFEALGRPAPTEPTPIDLRAVLAERALAAGVAAEHVTISEHCTRCTGSGLYSHRAGAAERQAGFLAVRSGPS